MRRLMRADLRRIRRKKGFWILLFFLALYQFTSFLGSIDSRPEEIMADMQTKMSGLVMLFCVIYIYLAVFADDVRSNAEVIVTGRGMRKGTYLFTKLLDCLLLTVFFYGAATAVREFFFRAYEPPLLTDRQMRLLLVYSVFMVIRAIWCLAFAALVQHLTGSTAPAVLSIVITALFADAILKALQTLYRVRIYDFVPGGLIDAAFRNLAAGKLPWQIAVVIVIYVGGAIWAAAAIFQKKEMEL